VTLLLNRELVSRAKLCLVSVFTDIVEDRPKISNLPKIFLRSFKHVNQVLYKLSPPSVDVICARLPLARH